MPNTRFAEHLSVVLELPENHPILNAVTLPARWQVLRSPPMDGAWNMACDLWMMEVAKSTGNGILRVYSWSRPTVSFGRNERALDHYSAESLAAAGLDAVRRPTGGRALLHSREVTYAVAIPIPQDTTWQAAYDATNQIVLSAMQILGVPAEIVGEDTATTTDTLPRGAPCFAGASRGEIAVNGAKLVASAVWRDRAAFLQHGSILLHDDQMLLTTIANSGIPLPEPAAALSGLLTQIPSFDAVANAIEVATKQIADVVTWKLSADDTTAIKKVREQLEQTSWLWRS
ncbi:MAG: hypothetical protein ABJB66_04355 [Gemmatimonadaceae bacterium]